MSQPVTILWFKRDLRSADHPALASVQGRVIPLYIAEPEVWSAPDAAARHWRFVAESLTELRADLATRGTPLVVRQGEAVAVLEALRQAHPLHRLVSHQETGLMPTWQRDRRVADWARSHGIQWDEPIDSAVFRRLGNRDLWSGRRDAFVRATRAEPPARLSGPIVEPGDIPDARDLGLPFDPCPGRQAGGRQAGLSLLGGFLAERGRSYRADMSSPVAGEVACSRISPHLAWGTLSVREVHQATAALLAELRAEGGQGEWARSMSSFLSRLAWRDHFTQKLEDFPALDSRPMHPAFADLRASAAGQAELTERLERWSTGQTGLPFVDACMRYARATGWLNFRMRAMVQCVASYHLWLDWRDTGPVLARLWTDYAPGIHWSQVQMQSGVTGINQLRIYNPVKQGQDQDPTGIFTRKWVPELRDVPDAALQQPWEIGGVRRYPAPLVDVALAARAARERMAAARRHPGFREDALQVYERLGSRKAPRERVRGIRKTPADARQGEFGF
ncbi:FAD-binding domain-containing protein [Jannaschia pohangensis]|uniref:Deoxyribodipyrimidine photo-lyase family protein (Cryptochrome) n=1 Tax=Jannaschia pohangensis TaxID=390807 RepID=A0A1I3SKD4_9RHOB|nr:FAD-binding domain-containing protein [Jannaschia pohangensis]SFJ59214.1 deoxyribodipyrimidine photo-lyase family protein (cryptochrome) [Jannaschia pohangensis]